MLNLALSSCSVLPPDPALTHCTSAAIDCTVNRLWVVSSELVLRYIEVNGGSFEVNLASDIIGTGLVTSDDKVIGIECLPEMNLVVIATRNGEFLSCNSITVEVEGVGSVCKGFLCMSWSPDQEVVVMVTGNRNLLLMTREFDPLTEIPMDSNEFGEAQPVAVGWGKKETQFHGSLGKQHAQQISTKPITPAGPQDDHTPRVSWRGDGEYFACSIINTQTGARVFRVWSRDGTLHSTGEPTDGLEQPLSWRPSGNLIACCQRKPHTYDVIFFESNGLKHGEFSLPESHTEWVVHELLWNADSTVLGVWLERPHHSSSNNKCCTTLIQLWTTKNYHWYLKQQLHPLSEDRSHSAVCVLIWDPIVPLRLHLLTTSGQYLVYTWCTTVCSSGYLSDTNKGGVAVIDGADVLWTPFCQVSIPPPMCAHKVTFPLPVLLVAFAPPPRSNDFLTLLSDGTISIIKVDERKDLPIENDAFKSVATLPSLSSNLSLLEEANFSIHDLRHLVWIDKDTLLGVTSKSCDKSHDLYCDFIVEYAISDTALKEKSCIQCCGQVVCVHGNHNSGSVVVQFQDGSVYRYQGSSLHPWITESGDHVTFGGVACDQIALATFKDKESVIGLNTKRRQLFVDNMKVSFNCTSFTVHDEFVLLTTDTHYLKVLPRHCSPSPLPTPDLQTDRDPAGSDESIRRVERGARLVLAIPSDFRVILQMPRGNLETVCPRALVLTRIRRYIDNLQYREAFLIMRKHRLNLNFLCDYDFKSFMSNARLFVEQVADVSFINLFLTELKSEDTTQTMYPTPFWYGNHSPDWPDSHSNKVNLICDTLLNIFYSLGERRYTLCIITTLTKKSPSELETVLKKIQWLKDEATPPNFDVGRVTAEEALRYAMLLVDVNELYDVALGMYDFALVLMVAEKSQKDPKEYLPFLNDLKRLPETYRRYRIDKYLKRYEKALISISQCGPERFEEGLSLIKEQKLYKEAMKLYKAVGSHEYHVISVLYGEHLMENGYHKEAGIVFEGCGELERALSCYDKADLWRHILIASFQAGHSEERRREIATKTATKLRAQGCHCDAATVLLDYLGDSVEAIRVLIEGKEWAESLRLIYLHEHLEMIAELFKPSLIEAHHSQMLFIEGHLLTFNRHVNRLEVVRKEKAAKALLEEGVATDEKDMEMFSDVSTVTGMSSVGSSKMSRASNKTAKSRKKAERKKHSLKEGSAHEDIALMEALKEITESTNNVQEETGSLLLALSQFQFESEAKELQDSFTTLLRTIQSHYKEIWPPDNQLVEHSNSSIVTGPSATVNSIVGSLKPYCTARNVVVSAPQIKKSNHWKLTSL